MSDASTFVRLWEAEECPIRDGLYLADGRALSVRADPAVPGGLAVLEPFDIDALLAEDPDWVTSVAISKTVGLAGTEDLLFCGEGSWGAEGLFGRITAAGQPVWVIYLGESNPFTEIEIEGSEARFRSTSDVVIRVEVTGPGTSTGQARPAERGR